MGSKECAQVKWGRKYLEANDEGLRGPFIHHWLQDLRDLVHFNLQRPFP